MNKEFVTYNQALALKELGFDEPCFGIFMKEKLCNHASPLGIANSDSITALTTSYSDLIPQAQKDWVVAPLKQQVFRWFREKNEFYASIIYMNSKNAFYITVYGEEKIEFYFDSYNEAELACIDKLIEIVKENGNI